MRVPVFKSFYLIFVDIFSHFFKLEISHIPQKIQRTRPRVRIFLRRNLTEIDSWPAILSNFFVGIVPFVRIVAIVKWNERRVYP